MPTAPYGTWKSPITAEAIVAGGIGLGDPKIDGDTLYWQESRPTEGGRSVIVRRHPDGRTEDVIPPPFNARTRVHEYGGADYLVDGGTVYFTNFADQHIYAVRPGAAPVQLTRPAGPEALGERETPADASLGSSPSPHKPVLSPVEGERGPGGEDTPPTPPGSTGGAVSAPIPTQRRYADFDLDRTRNRLICVRETHYESPDGAHVEPTNDIAAIDLATGAETTLTGGHDFYAYPRLSPDGHHLAWIAWDHPNMPWDATTLYVAAVTPAGTIEIPQVIAGGPGESVLQPTWSPEGRLHYLSDRTGYWNLYRLGALGEPATNLAPLPYDFGEPLWQLGTTTFAFDAASGHPGEDGEGGAAARLVTLYCVDGLWRLATIDPATGSLTDIDAPITSAGDLTVANGRAYFTAGFADRPAALVAVDLATGGIETIKSVTTLALDPAYISLARPIEFPTENGLTAHAFYYPPHNADYESPGEDLLSPAPNTVAEASSPRPNAQDDISPLPRRERGPGGEDPTSMPPASAGGTELPPLLVMSHGGPTGDTVADLRPRIQYWTSRGIAVLDVNYGGSTGYGRAYRQRLNGAWGIVDVADCVNGALYLANQGLVDPDRLAITGGSAGGYTTLAALTFYDVFKAGASHYGIGDLEALATDTHKFESRYLDNLIGPYPQARDTYVERSPIHHTEKLSCPVIFFQGLEDQVVPPNQAETMVAALRAKGVPVAYFPFEGEQHGFRRAENIKRSLEAELAFYGRIFNFTPADDIEPFEIQNL